MQDFIVNAATWIAPEPAQAERRAAEESAPYELDEASLAQFEALLPVGPCDRVAGSNGEGGSSSVGGIGGVGGAGTATVGATTFHDPAAARNDSGGRRTELAALQGDTIVSTYTIHHARLGVVHVQQSEARRGVVGALVLRTDDAALRARLRNAMPALRGAFGDGDGRGTDISVDA
ncbi:MAG: hypothetical protein EOP73_20905 [Variovorax sp.]|jgi:hypothetical protein|nr:MAG: hypothetical protein EOP73_20905 [Variovorax sp.]